MVRRQCFDEANHRIAKAAKLSALQSIQTRSTKNRTKSNKKKLAEPPRISKRLNRHGIKPPQIPLDVSNNLPSNKVNPQKNLKDQNANELLSNDVAILEMAKRISCRRVTVAMEKLSMGTMNDLLGIEHVPQQDIALSQPMRSTNEAQVNDAICRPVKVLLQRLPKETMDRWLGIQVPREVVVPKKIITRRCTILLERIDLSNYQVQPMIEENEDELTVREFDLAPPKSIVQIEELAELIDEPMAELIDEMPQVQKDVTTAMEICDEICPETSHEKSSIISNQNLLRTLDVKLEAKRHSRQMHEDVSSIITNGNNVMSSIVSDQNVSLSAISRGRSTPKMNFTPRSIIAEALKAGKHRDTTHPMNRLNLNTSYDATTYFHVPTGEASTHLSPVVAVRNRQVQSSQTQTRIPWDLVRSVSISSLNAQYSRTSNENSSDAGVFVPKKGFIDSPYVSYHSFVVHKTGKFAINCFDHGDETIQYNFLSKFNRIHFSALNSQFKGYLYTSETTGDHFRIFNY